mmetsp:Transcript_40410/g.68921  ORF Transcript_40410/g.68921 Transcript_40410/m.68921 type:complete len:83 (+) Transcript_40410:460-708(+)
MTNYDFLYHANHFGLSVVCTSTSMIQNRRSLYKRKVPEAISERLVTINILGGFFMKDIAARISYEEGGFEINIGNLDVRNTE